ncbi:hypothetical protein ATANTOWER_005793 [Ataeniobius toweri]|uniref:Uncharacterized protein n=1 Tax=Ataeniobius toweri TaxID=208326 RepID=A0ABU7ADW6_9TELE|nr:hypothetical protein [Ataeniobius toweri]
MLGCCQLVKRTSTQTYRHVTKGNQKTSCHQLSTQCLGLQLGPTLFCHHQQCNQRIIKDIHLPFLPAVLYIQQD